MRTTIDSATHANAAAQEEHPFRSLEHGWRPLERHGRRGGPRVQTSLEIVLDPERSAWVLQQAARAGVDFESYVKSLIDAARTREGERDAEPA